MTKAKLSLIGDELSVEFTEEEMARTAGANGDRISMTTISAKAI